MNEDFIRLEIRVEHPEEAVEDEVVSTTYHIRNISDVKLGRVTLTFHMTWAMAPNYRVNHPVTIEGLDPGETHSSEPFYDRPITTGMTFYTTLTEFTTDERQRVVLNTIDGALVFKEKPIGGFSVKSSEEKMQRREIRIAIIALVITATFQVLDWLFQYWWVFQKIFDL